MVTESIRAESTKNYASDIDACQIVSYHPNISQRRNPSTDSVESLKSLLRTHSNLNPRVQPGPDYLTWSGEERLTYAIQCLESVATRDLKEKSECLWNCSLAFLMDLVNVSPPGSKLYDSAATLIEDIFQQFSSEIRTADRDQYASNCFKSIGLEIDVHFVDDEPSFFAVQDLFDALQTRLKEDGHDFEIHLEDEEWVCIQDTSMGSDDGFLGEIKAEA